MTQEDLASWFISEVAARLPRVLGDLGVAHVTAQVGTPVELPAGWRLWWEQPLSYPPGARVVIGASDEIGRALGSQILTAAGLAADDEASRETYFEAMTQVCGAAAQALGSRMKRDSVCLRGRILSSPPAVPMVTIRIAQGPQTMELLMAASLTAGPASAPSPSSDVKPTTVAEPSEVTGPVRPMDLLLDVELPVSVSFGRAQLPLKDVIKLTSGSIVELNRSISEPVEVIVNNCVIARGEVVVIEGNYGVRIDQIVSRQERLRSLK